MNEYNCRIYLHHDSAKELLNEILHPDIDLLRSRDKAIKELDSVHPYRHDGTDLISDIPDIDVLALMEPNTLNSIYIQVKVDIENRSNYYISSLIDVAA